MPSCVSHECRQNDYANPLGDDVAEEKSNRRNRANARKDPASPANMPTYQANSKDTESFGRVAKICIDAKANEAYVSDGYLNNRVAVLDLDTGKMKRMWGAYGKA